MDGDHIYPIAAPATVAARAAVAIVCVLVSACTTPTQPGARATTSPIAAAHPTAGATPIDEHRAASTSVGTIDPADTFSAVLERLHGVQDTRGTAATLAELDHLVNAWPQMSGICHAIAHDLGHRELKVAAGNAAE